MVIPLYVKGKTQERPAEGPPDVMQDGFLEFVQIGGNFKLKLVEVQNIGITTAGMKRKSRRALLCHSLPTFTSSIIAFGQSSICDMHNE